MVKNFLIALLLLVSTTAFGQLTYKLTIVNDQQYPVSNLPVVLKETSTKEKLRFNSDQYGNVSFTLNTGQTWSMSIGEMTDYKILEVPESGQRNATEFITYDLKRWDREHRPLPDRSKLNITFIKQDIAKSAAPSEKKSVVSLIMKRSNKKPLTDYRVDITSLKDNITYQATTDKQGIARFYLPIGQEYEIDIDGIESFQYLEVFNRSGYQQREFVYEPTLIQETTVNDTITQSIDDNTGATSARYLYTLEIKNKDGSPAANENVYLRTMKSRKIYAGKSDAEGKVKFLLPKKRKYMIDMDFQKDINIIDLTQTMSGGIGQGNMRFSYVPNPKLQFPEQYIPSTEDLLVVEFNNFLKKQYPKPEKDKALRMDIKWGNGIFNKKTKEALLEIGFSATNDESNAYGPPINISFVMDKSGSMEGYDRIDELKKSLVHFVSALRPKDIASLIIFDSEPEMLIGAGKIQDNKDEFISTIKSIQAGGYTKIQGGLVLGYEEVLKNMQPKGTNRVILLSDGYGDDEPKVIVAKSKEYNAKGIELSAIGVGQDYNQPLLKLLSTNGGGMFEHVSDAINLQESFNRELAGMLYPIARDVKVEIIYNNKIVFKQLYGFPFNAPKGTNVSMKLDNIYPGLNKLALVKFDLNKPDKSIENMPVTIKMTYFDYRTQKNVIDEQKTSLKWQESDGQLELIPDMEEKKLYAIAIMNQSLKVMADAFSKDDYPGAEKAVNRGLEQMQELYPEVADEDLNKLFLSLKEYSDILKQYKLNKIKK